MGIRFYEMQMELAAIDGIYADAQCAPLQDYMPGGSLCGIGKFVAGADMR